MRIVVLGSAAGGGFPQWNSNGDGCCRARAGDPAALPRTQASIAVTGDGDHWYVFNASPDLREQIGRSTFLYPRRGVVPGARHSPISGVILTGGDVDVVAGLLSLRERHPFTLYAAARIHAVLDANPMFEVLARDIVSRESVTLDKPVDLLGGLTVTLFAVPGKAPLYLENAEGVEVQTDGVTVGAAISDGPTTALFIPGCAGMTEDLAARIDAVDLVFFDGTLWSDDEMLIQGVGTKTGRRMGHMSLIGPGGTLAAFEGLKVARKVLIHLNNSNPVLVDDSPERLEVVRRGWCVAHDGWEITL